MRSQPHGFQCQLPAIKNTENGAAVTSLRTFVLRYNFNYFKDSLANQFITYDSSPTFITNTGIWYISTMTIHTSIQGYTLVAIFSNPTRMATTKENLVILNTVYVVKESLFHFHSYMHLLGS